MRRAPASVALMIGLVYESKTSMSGNESGIVFAREGFLDPRCPRELVHSSLRRDSRHVIRNSGSSARVRDWAASRSSSPRPDFASPWAIPGPQRGRPAGW